MSYIVPLEMPKTCSECFFLSKSEYIGIGKGLYKRICCCNLAPENIQDPYRTFEWFCDNKEKWCPLIDNTHTKGEDD